MATSIFASRRFWMASSIGAASAAMLPVFGFKPRFRNGWHFPGAAKSVSMDSTLTRGQFARPRAVCCLVLGDWGSGLPLQNEVAAGMQEFAAREHPQFIISTGDNFYPSGIQSIDDSAWEEKFERVYTGLNLQIPWFAALGNHDHKGSIEPLFHYETRNKRWNLPSRWYNFSRTAPSANVDFYVLDTEPFAMGDTDLISQQVRWFEDRLVRSTATWRVCVGHHPMRSYGHYGPTPLLLEHVKPLLDQHRVAAYLCGHDHDLQLLKNEDDNFVCVVSGGGGKARDATIGQDTLFAGTNGGFASLTFTRSEMAIAFLTPDGEIAFVQRILSMAA